MSDFEVVAQLWCGLTDDQRARALRAIDGPLRGSRSEQRPMEYEPLPVQVGEPRIAVRTHIVRSDVASSDA